MLLAIDAGNTNTTFAVFAGDDLKGEWRMATKATHTADEYAVWLTQLAELAGLAITDVDAAIIACVVPQALFDLRKMCRTYFKADPLVVGEPGVELGIRNLLARPQDVGADRLVNAVAAHAMYSGPTVVVDFGTATNIDIVDSHGNYHGGILAPGVNLNLEALHQASAKLPRIAVARPERVIGKDTISAMQSGVYWGYISLIEGLVRRIAEEYGEPMTVIGTGGLAPLFAGGTDVIAHVEPDLTMRGLLHIARRNGLVRDDA